MYCLQWLIPVLLIPKPVNPTFFCNHDMFIAFYLAGFFLERKPCTICSLVFLTAVFLLCYSCYGPCVLWTCEEDSCNTGSAAVESTVVWRHFKSSDNSCDTRWTCPGWRRQCLTVAHTRHDNGIINCDCETETTEHSEECKSNEQTWSVGVLWAWHNAGQ